MIPRQREAAIREMLFRFPIMMVTGRRQAGKTTLLREMSRDYEYVNLEFAANRETAMKWIFCFGKAARSTW